METKLENPTSADQLQILLVGNNPIDMSRIVEKINQINGANVITEIAFDLKSIVERLINFNPNFILIDDNIGKHQLHEAVEELAHRPTTRHTPITILKNSNYEESGASGGMLDYLLKTNITTESLCNTVRNSLRFKRTQMYLAKAYIRRREALKNMSRSAPSA
jgi:CheY-like chemotaxis protein